MDHDAFEITVDCPDPDAVLAWIRENFADNVTHVTALEIGKTERFRCRIIGRDRTVAAAIRLYWHNQDT